MSILSALHFHNEEAAVASPGHDQRPVADRARSARVVEGGRVALARNAVVCGSITRSRDSAPASVAARIAASSLR